MSSSLNHRIHRGVVVDYSSELPSQWRYRANASAQAASAKDALIALDNRIADHRGVPRLSEDFGPDLPPPPARGDSEARSAAVTLSFDPAAASPMAWTAVAEVCAESPTVAVAHLADESRTRVQSALRNPGTLAREADNLQVDAQEAAKPNAAQRFAHGLRGLFSKGPTPERVRLTPTIGEPPLPERHGRREQPAPVYQDPLNPSLEPSPNAPSIPGR